MVPGCSTSGIWGFFSPLQPKQASGLVSQLLVWGPSWAWWWAKLFLMDLHKTICISAPAHWKAIDKMIMIAGPRNCSKMCNHFVCCIQCLLSFVYLYSLGPVRQSKVIIILLDPVWSPFRFEMVFLTYHPSAFKDAFYIKCHANRLSDLARGALSAADKG